MKDKIYNLFKKIVLNIANKKYPEIKKRTYPLEYYLNNFIYVLNDVVKWKSLRLFNPLKKEYHWSLGVVDTEDTLRLI